MKLLLTSAGITNESITQALKELLGKEIGESKLVYITTAAVAEAGNHDWMIDDLNRTYQLGWKEFNLLELNGLPREMIIERLANADVIYAGGGNVYHLARSIVDNDLAGSFKHLLEKKVYVGVSAGSMIFSKYLSQRTAAIFGEEDELYQIRQKEAVSPFESFDWYIKPHAYSMEGHDEAWLEGIADKVDFPLYAIDDSTAIKVVGTSVEVISEGRWKLL